MSRIPTHRAADQSLFLQGEIGTVRRRDPNGSELLAVDDSNITIQITQPAKAQGETQKDSNASASPRASRLIPTPATASIT